MSKVIPVELVRQQFLEHVAVMTDYWHRQVSDKTIEDRLSGLAFSILAAIDGCALALPGFQMIASPHVDDKADHIKHGEDYYESVEFHPQDIAGSLHEQFYSVLDKMREDAKAASDK